MLQESNPVLLPGNNSFFEDLPATTNFLELASGDHYVAMPDDWVVIVTDIVTSRHEIEKGKYKAVNMVGAAIIAAVKNIADGIVFPFVFGGDGATVAVPGDYEYEARAVSLGLQHWAKNEFDLDLRAGVMSVSDIRAVGRDVLVAKYAASDSVSYASFSGGGVSWLERQVKSGEVFIEDNGSATPPNVDGLSCRWSNLQAVNGNIVSIVLEPTLGRDPAEFGQIVRKVLHTIYQRTGNSGPVPESGPNVQFPPPGMGIEARASRAGKSIVRRYLELFLENLVAWILFRTGWKIGKFDPGHYSRQAARNTDHQKFEDGLKMTIDCDDTTVTIVEDLLSRLKTEGKIRFGLKVQSEALVTCIVSSPLDDDHIHFVDGANGGYAAAASML